MSKARAWRWRMGWALAALSLGACAAGPAVRGVGRTAAAPQGSPQPAAPLASPGRADGAASAPALAQGDGVASAPSSLPLRLGLVLPTSLVGASANARLKGEGGLVAPERGQLVALADGRIVSNHGAGLVSNHGGGLVANHGAGLVANHGAGAGAAARRLLATDLERIRDDRRTFLWSMLAMLDLNDQLLQAFLQAQPRLGSWLRFRAAQARVLPLPVGAELFALAAGQIEQVAQQQPLAGLMSSGPEGLRLRLVLLKAEGGPVSQGVVLLDLGMREGQSLGRAQWNPTMAEALGFERLSARIQGLPGGGLRVDTGERFLPREAHGPLARAVQPDFSFLAVRRRLTVQQDERGRFLLELRRSAVNVHGDTTEDVVAFGAWADESKGAGLASYVRERLSPSDGRFRWKGRAEDSGLPEGVPELLYQGPDGEVVASPGADLQALAPPYRAGIEAEIPPPPALTDDPSAEGDRLPPALDAEALAAPGASL